MVDKKVFEHHTEKLTEVENCPGYQYNLKNNEHTNTERKHDYLITVIIHLPANTALDISLTRVAPGPLLRSSRSASIRGTNL